MSKITKLSRFVFKLCRKKTVDSLFSEYSVLMAVSFLYCDISDFIMHLSNL